MLSARAEFSNSTDAVPFAGSVSTVIKIDPNGELSQRDLNIVSEHYWGISKVFSRQVWRCEVLDVGSKHLPLNDYTIKFVVYRFGDGCIFQ